MPVLGLVLTHPDPARLAAMLPGVPGLAALGAAADGRLPVVFHTADRAADTLLLEQLQCLDGVLAVDLAFVDFSDLEPVCP